MKKRQLQMKFLLTSGKFFDCIENSGVFLLGVFGNINTDSSCVFLTYFTHSQRNREHAKKSRQRKKNLTLTLQTSVQELKEENESLKQMIRSKFGEESMDCMKEENQLSPAEKFINALQMPGSKFMTKSTLTFLKSYSDSVKTSMAHRQNAMRYGHHM